MLETLQNAVNQSRLRDEKRLRISVETVTSTPKVTAASKVDSRMEWPRR